MNNEEITKEITQKIIKYFKKNLCSILLYGSSISAKKNPNDIDLIVILNKRETKADLLFLRKNINKYNKEIDLQVLNIIDIKSKHFSHDSHGEFFIKFLKQAKVLYGENPFTEIIVDYSRQVSSVVQKMQYYYYRAKKIQTNSPINMNDKLYAYHRKKLILLMSDFYLAYSGEILSFDKKNNIKKITSILNIKLNNNEINFLLGRKINFDWAKIFNLYQMFYFKSIDILEPKVDIFNTTVDNIFITIFKNKLTSNKCVIIASGCPSNYDESEITLFLNIRGYDVITFHYSGTGYSLGDLFVSPVDDLSKIINFYQNNYKNIIILGNSYGGFSALSLKNKSKKITKIIAISPVIDFMKLKNYSSLPVYLKKERGNEYRFDSNDMLNFMKNRKVKKVTNSKNIKIIHGIYDDQISAKSVEKFCKQNKIKLELLPAKHLSLNKLSKIGLLKLSKYIK